MLVKCSGFTLKAVKIILLTSLLFLTMIGVSGFMILSDAPKTEVASHEQINDADSVNQLLMQLKRALHKRYSRQSILITEPQVRSFLGLIGRARNDLMADVEFENGQARLFGSIHLNNQLLDRYINFEVVLLPGEGLTLGSVELGDLRIPGPVALDMLEWLGNWWTNSDIATMAIDQVYRVAARKDVVMMAIEPIDPFLTKLNGIKNGITTNPDEPLRLRTSYYLAYLHEMPVDDHLPDTSLVEYINPLFAHVAAQSATKDPVLENEAAIVALAIYTGHHRLANLVGDVQPIPGIVVLPKFRPMLSGRYDLTQHFVVSAGLNILSRRNASLALGEFKELVDRAKGGSGYSFVDMAADMAGNRFAELASDPTYARKLQAMLSTIDDEVVFFPDISGLPERLDKRSFEQHFGQVDSVKYKRQLAQISDRIEQLPLFVMNTNSQQFGEALGD